MLYSFPPIADQNCRILILGTMPGPQSLRKKEYYGNRQNTFWRILFNLFDEPLSEIYEEKVEFLLRHHIAVWDVLQACEREGSGDAEITDAVPNDFEGFFKIQPQIRTVFFNGGYAEKFFKRYVLKDLKLMEMDFIRLPSTSPAFAAAFEKKLEKWGAVRIFFQ